MKMDGIDERSTKRRKLDRVSQSHEQVFTSASQLYEALRFRQGIGPETKQNVNYFKDFLSGISRNEDLASQAKQLQILRQYCNDQTAASKDELDFPDLIATWSFAAQSNNDALCSAVPATLAQFFRTISGFLEFREFGLSLCHSLMKRDQVKLFDRGLSASKSKEHVISPCLRLLTEVVSFDGGTLSNHVFTRRDIIYKRLDVLLHHNISELEADRRRPTARRMALRLIIANLKYLDDVAKSEFVTQMKIIRACMNGLIDDGDDIVVDVLQAINIGIVEDPKISRTSKLRFFNADTLTSLAALYEYEPDFNHADAEVRVRDALQNLLSKVCASRKGIVMLQNGWYPMGSDRQLDIEPSEGFIDLGLDSPLYFDEYSNVVPVKNTVLSAFAQTLKPDSDTLQTQLILQMFKAAPELVADYLSKKERFAVASGDDATFRGHFAFLFSISQLPIPKNLGLHDTEPRQPPPTSVVIESILPRPFDRTALTRCFTLNDEILIMSGSRLLTIALKKLNEVLETFAKVTETRRLWEQASMRLVEAVLERVPRFKDVTDTINRFSTKSETLRLSLFECIAMYYRVLPEAIAGSKFDISPVLLEELAYIQPQASLNEAKPASPEQVSHLVEIGHLAPNTRWLAKSNMETLSLFSLLLKYASNEIPDTVSVRIKSSLAAIASAAGFIASPESSFLALQSSLQVSKKFHPGEELYLFLDNSVHRAVQKPVKYLDRIEAVQHTVSDNKPLSLLACAVAEQWEHAVKKYVGSKDIIKNVADWTARFFNALEAAGENFRVMASFQEEMMAKADSKSREYLQKAFEKIRKKPPNLDLTKTEDIVVTDQHYSDGKRLPDPPKPQYVDLSSILGMPVSAPVSLEGLDRWDSKTDIELAMQSGRVAKLVRCTASPEEEIRRQTFELLQSLAHLLDESAYSEKAQIYLLVGELCETVRQHGLDTPLPSAAAELGAGLLPVLSNPTHKLFGKANKFLLRGPSWELKKLIPHWVDKILFHEPESEDPNAWTEEVEWLIQWLIDGLKTAADMEVYRRAGIFEKILALYADPRLARNTKRMILTVLWRAICVGGANTLITRVGLDKWLEVATLLDADHQNIIQGLKERLLEASDQNVIEHWRSSRPILRHR